METLEEIKEYLIAGDIRRVAFRSKLSVENVRKILKRPNAKRYNDVLSIARSIAEQNKADGLHTAHTI